MTNAAEGKSATAAEPRSVPLVTGRGLFRKIWLPRFVYESLPWFYPAAALCGLGAALYIGDWIKVLPRSLVLLAACLHLSVYVLQQRFRRKPRGRTEDTGSPAGA